MQNVSASRLKKECSAYVAMIRVTLRSAMIVAAHHKCDEKSGCGRKCDKEGAFALKLEENLHLRKECVCLCRDDKGDIKVCDDVAAHSKWTKIRVGRKCDKEGAFALKLEENRASALL
ncbi:hypothetical protein ACJJTC_018022 [Scirpophaga incertulas]